MKKYKPLLIQLLPLYFLFLVCQSMKGQDLEVFMFFDDYLCIGECTVIDVTVTGGASPYLYDFYGNAGNPIFNGEFCGDSPGVYTLGVVVTDSDGNTAQSEGVVIVDFCQLEVEIEGPEQICINECTQYTAVNYGATQICGYLWTYQGNYLGNTETLDFCPSSGTGGYLNLEVTDCNSGIDETFTQYIEVISNFPLEIVSTSPASCPDNDDNSVCDKTCSNSTVTYTVPQSQNLDLEWEVIGAQSYEVDNNLVTVDWGNPGVGEISVHTAPATGGTNSILQLNCAQIESLPFTFAVVFTADDNPSNPSYFYNWCDGQTGPTANSLPPGPCQVTVTDPSSGVSEICEVMIVESAPGCNGTPELNYVSMAFPSCNGSSDGSITILPSGTGTYNYLWSNGAQTNINDNLSAGEYCVTVTQSNGCSISECLTIYDPAPIFLNTYVIQSPTSPGDADGIAGVQAFEGIPPYQYLWNTIPGNGVGPIINNISIGSYEVTVTDSNGCTGVGAITINPIDASCPMNGYITVDAMPSSCLSSDAALTMNGIASGGTNYSVVWSNAYTTASISNLSAGDYCATLTNDMGCEIVDCITLPCTGTSTPPPNTCSGEGSLCIDIIPEPEAKINSNPPAVNGFIELCKGETVFLQNESTYAENYVWQLGDGYSTSAEELSYAYAESGLYTVLLIAKNECFCIDTTTINILVSDAEIPEILCSGTICANNTQTYTTAADCSTLLWSVSANGTITDGGGPGDDFVTVDWSNGPIGEVSLQVSNCNTPYCDQPTIEQIPIIMDGVFIEGPAKICPGENSTYSVPLWTGTSYVWTVANGGEIKSGQSTNTVLVKWNVEMDANDPLWVAVEYDNCFLECGGQSTKDVAITPEFYLAGSIEACENTSSEYMAFDALQNNPVACNWTVTDPTGALTWSANNQVVVDIPWPLLSGKYTLEANPVDPNAFCNNDYTIYVNVQAGPPALTAIDGQNAICPNEYYTYEAVSNQGNVSYQWQINNGGAITEVNGEIINVQWGNNPPYELTVTQTSTNGLACSSLPYTMVVNEISTIDWNGPTAVCIESISSFSATPIGNATYNWNISPFDAGTLLGGQGTDSIEILWHAVGAATLTVSVCGFNENIAVQVAGFPSPTVFDSGALCPGFIGPVGTIQNYSSYSWQTENGSVISTSSSPDLGPGFYEVVVTNSTGCEGQTSFEIDELPGPEVTISNPIFDQYCIAAGYPIPTLYALNTDDGYTYQWFQNGSALNVFSEVFTPTSSGTFYVQVTDINGCISNSNSITLTESCANGGGPPIPGNGQCPDVSNTAMTGAECHHGLFQNTSINYQPGTVQWFFDDPASGANNYSTLENPQHYFSGAGFYNIVMTATSPSGATCFIYSPFEVPVVAAIDAHTSCPGLASTFEDISTFTPGTTITNWAWNFGDPASGSNNTSTLETPSHVYANAGAYNVTLVVTVQTGCTSTTNKVITVVPPPVASFALPQNSCQETALSFQADPNTGITSWAWNFGDPASGEANTTQSENTYHAFTAAGTYDVQLTVSNIYNCTHSTIVQMNVDANNLNGDISMDPGSPICEGNSTTMTVPTGGTSWNWSTDELTENITAIEAGVYDVTISDDQGCTYSPEPAVLDIIPEPEATIKVTEYNEFGQPADCFYDGYILCEGEDVYLSITGAGDYSYVWSTNQTGDEIVFDEEHNNTLPSGTYDYIVTVTDNISGCTSVEGPYTVIVNPVPTDILIETSPPGPICEGTEASFFVTNPDAALSYLWSTGEIGENITASTAGEYFVIGTSSFGCEGESNTLEIHRAPDVNLVPDGCHIRCAPDTICLPEMEAVISYQWYLDGNPIPAPEGTVANYLPQISGSYAVAFFDENGCNASSEPFEIDLLPFDTDSLELGACSGNIVTFAGEDLLPGSVTDFHFTNQWGCDSMITVTVIEDALFEFDEILSTCVGTPIIYNGVSYNAGTEIDLNYVTSAGCDSIIHLEVLALPTNTMEKNYSSCTGVPVSYAGEDLLPGTVTSFEFQNQYDCDSIVTVTVLEDLAYNEVLELSACEGGMVTYQGIDYSAGTQEIFNYTTLAGCDSVIQLNIASNPVYNMAEALSTCEGSQIEFAGLMLDIGTDTLFQFLNQFGCDSTIQVTVTGIDAFEEELPMSACTGSTAIYEGVDYPIGTDEYFTYSSVEGCDSIVHLTVAALPVYDTEETYSTCTGTTISYGNQELLPGTVTTFSLLTQQGCDSIVQVTVLEDLAYEESVDISGCEGETINYQGVDYPVGTQQVFNFTTLAGCDSNIVLTIAALPLSDHVVQLGACPGETVLYINDELPAGSTTDYVFPNQFGCDSFVQVIVAAYDTSLETVNLSGCEGSTVSFGGVEYPVGTQTNLPYVNQWGCDSIIELNVSALSVSITSLSLEACAETSIDYNGNSLLAGTTTEFLYTDINGCDSIVIVEVIPYPDFDFALSATEIECYNAREGEIKIENVTGGTTPFTYGLDAFNFQSDTLMDNLPPGTYTVYVRDGNGCIEEQEISIAEIPELVVAFNEALLSCEADSVIVQSQLLSGFTDSMTYQWQDGVAGLSTSVYLPGLYVLSVTNTCETRAFEVAVAAEELFREKYLYVPNAFSPNGDGNNDIFKALPAANSTVLEYELNLYDRWGNVLYRTTEVAEGWDGIFKEEAMNPGVYVWWLRAKVLSCKRNVIEVFDKGDVTILK